MIAFAKRNLKLYFRDKSSVFFSLMAVFVILALYIFFLGDVWADTYDFADGIKEVLNNWVMAGILAVTGVTTTTGMLETMVKDRCDKIQKDFYVAPVKKSALAAGYFISANVVGNIMTFIAFILAEIYIVVEGGSLLSPKYMLAVVAFILYSNLMNTSIVLFMVSLFKSRNAYATASTIIGTLIGFLTGIYIPIGSFPNGVQWVIKCFPISHSAVVFRQIMMHDSMATVFEGAPQDVISATKESLGVIYSYGDYEMGTTGNMLVVLITAIVFFLLSCFVMNKQKE